MEENKEKKLDDLIRKAVKEIGLECPSVDFTKTLNAKIELSARADSVTMYKPLISKAGWAIMAVIVLSFSVVALDYKIDIQMVWLEKIKMAALSKMHFLEALPNLGVSKILFYSLFIFAVFVLIQMVILKQRLDRQYV